MRLFRHLTSHRPAVAAVEVSPHCTIDDGDSSSYASAHSTVTTGPDHKRFKSCHGKDLRVRFDPALDAIHEPPCRDDDDDENEENDDVMESSTWYTLSEMQEYKNQTRWSSSEIHQMEHQEDRRDAPSYSNVVEQIYAVCCRAAHEIQGEDDDDDDNSYSILTHIEQKNLSRYVQGHVSRIGLERLCVREIARDKRQRRVAVVDAALEQQQQQQQQQHEALKRHSSGHHREQAISLASRSVSLASRLFAREMALAQWEDSIFLRR